MQFYDVLGERTAAAREFLVTAPVIQQALAGQLSRQVYIDFLSQAYHHVRHTVPLLMAVGGRLPSRHEWLRQEIMHYLEEEQGHDEWILNDINAAGGDAQVCRHSRPHVSTAAMVSCAYDQVMRLNPVGFFGMVFVLEGTSVSLALRAAERIQSALGLPSRAFTYLRSHGQLDQEHVQHLASILNRLDAAQDRDAVSHCAEMMYWLYGSMFRSLDSITAPLAERKIA